MTPLEAVAALWRLKQQHPAEYRRLVARFEKAIEEEAERDSPLWALIAKRANEVQAADAEWCVRGVNYDPPA